MKQQIFGFARVARYGKQELDGKQLEAKKRRINKRAAQLQRAAGDDNDTNKQ